MVDMNDAKEEERKAKARERAAKRAVLRKEDSIAKEAKKAAPPEQEHRLKNGEVVTISRNGNHKYKLNGGSPMSNVSSYLDYTEKGGFARGVGWGTKKIRESGGDTTAPNRFRDESNEIGSKLHAAINDFIRYGEMSEDPLFVAWYDEIGKKHKWIVSEQFVVHPRLRYGGTVDALSEEDNGICLWDWKTKTSESYDKYGASRKDHVQVAAYMEAYRAMGSEFLPTTGIICYIMRDTAKVQKVAARTRRAWRMFQHALDMDEDGIKLDNDE